MKRFVTLLILFTVVAAAGAPACRGQRRPARVSMSAYYQHYEDDGRRLSELSFPVSVFLPVRSHLSFGVQASQANATGDEIDRLQGTDDVHVTLSYTRRIGTHNFLFSLGTNLPSGKRELTREEFRTSILLSRNFFPFLVPSLGQGFNVTPGLMWAMPLNENLVLGASAVYQFRGRYFPLQDMEEHYAPGDEVHLAGGLEYRLSLTMTLAADLAYTIYAKDQLGDSEIFELGNQTTLRLRWRAYVGFDELRLLAHYARQNKSRVLEEGGGTTKQTIPNQLFVQASYRKRLLPVLDVTILGQGRFFGKTEAFQDLLGEDLSASSKTMVDLGVMPQVRLNPIVSVMGRFLYTFGSTTGLEGGVGLTLTL